MAFRYRSRARSTRTSFRPRANSKRIQADRYVNASVEIEDQEVYVPKHTFADFGLNKDLVANLATIGYTSPTPIQDQAIPVMMDGRDVVGLANTGTGKTAAFLLPMLHKLILDNSQGLLVLAPTRELALQILDELKAYRGSLRVSSTLCIGGMNIMRQIDDLRRKPQIVIGTPGRIKDLINRGVFNTHLYTNIVLDEVDRMLDIGFRKDISFIISKLPLKRHAGFFSATINSDVEGIMASLLTDPVTISVKKQELVSQIDQDVVKIMPGQSKVDVLYELLSRDEFEKVIVFGRTKHGINKLEKILRQRGVRVSSIHGNKSQNARQYSLTEFKQGKVRALLATDVASRGIDIDDVTHVINYDEPGSWDDYVHRIGRTGRAGKYGKALTFVG